MTRLLIVLLFVCGVSRTMASCPEDQEPQFCQSNNNIPQLYCGTVDQENEWLCRKRSYGKCACRAGLYRRKDRKCVPKEECGANEKSTPKPEIPATTRPYGDLEIPEELQGDLQDIYNKVLKFFQTKQTIYALWIVKNTLPYNIRNLCACLKSKYIENTASGALRSLECYEDKQEITNTQLTRGGEVEFELFYEYYRLVIALNLDPREQSTARPEPDLRDKFYIMDVTDDCLLVNYGKGGYDRKCILWGADAKTISTTRCYKTMKEACSQDMEELWGERGSCVDHDK